jgi:hypothetical protein
VLVLGCLLAGCDDPPAGAPTAAEPAATGEPATVEERATTEEPATGEHLPAAGPTAGAESTSPAAEPERPLEPPPRELGLPELTRGPVVRLPAVEISERTVGDRTVPSVAIADAASRARLDEMLAEDCRLPGRCQVLLATETLVSLDCVRSFFEMGMMDRDHMITHYRVGIGGDVERVEIWDFLLEGAVIRSSQRTVSHVGEQDLERRLLYRNDAAQQRRVLTQTGLRLYSVLSPGETAEDEHRTTIGWRALAPYIRAETVLGEMLGAQGLALAPAGTRMPPMPSAGPAFWSDDPEPLLRIWGRLPRRERAQGRLITPGGEHAAALVFIPGSDRSVLRSVDPNVGEALFREPYASLVMARAERPLVIRERPGPRAEIVADLPRGTLVAAADGLVGDVDSRIGGGWALVSAGHHAGWVRGADVVPLSEEGACQMRPPRPSDVRGTAFMTHDGAEVTVGWFSSRGSLLIVPVRDCQHGPPLVDAELPGSLFEISFPRTGRDSGDSLVVIASGSEAGETLTVRVPGREEPVLVRELGNDPFDVSVTRGRDEYFPLRIGEGPRATFFEWNGTTLEEAH